MTVYVNNKKFDVQGRGDVDAFNALMHAIYHLPYTPIEEKSDAQVIACLEAEVSQCADTHGVELGTENIQNCVALYLYGGGRRFLIHVSDQRVDLDLNTYLERFPADAPVNAIIIGGNLSFLQSSAKNCIHIVDSLTRASRDITIVSQRILEPDATDTFSRNQAVLDRLLINFKLFYQYVFSRKMPNQIINMVKASDFDKHREHYRLADHLFPIVMKFILSMSPIKEDKWGQEFARLKVLNFWAGFQESTFESWMHEVVSKRGMAYMQYTQYIKLDINIKNCINFFFHHAQDGTVKISRMGTHLEKPFDRERMIHLYTNPHRSKPLYYFNAYVDGHFNKPMISSQNLDKVRIIRNHLQISHCARVIEDIKTFFPNIPITHYQHFADAILDYDMPKQENTAAAHIVSFAFRPAELIDDNDENNHRHKRLKMNVSSSAQFQ